MRDVAIAQLAEYGFGLNAEDHITRGEKTLGLKVSFKKDRMRVDTVPGGHKMFTGVDLGLFVAKFFFAVKVSG